ncbi:hypothetical protein H2199_001439 [Coniosporium tulheliwenetii]|uniref:Uncharacterized protein n=1 Tax=Coniosporium tulheliwenetii TaxID=3383036 RepID=A0ACC2ZM02_9PEZI|nr:hypothetical protein H2199_001439 [Cladosporium sp. JES 115]
MTLIAYTHWAAKSNLLPPWQLAAGSQPIVTSHVQKLGKRCLRRESAGATPRSATSKASRVSSPPSTLAQWSSHCNTAAGMKTPRLRPFYSGLLQQVAARRAPRAVCARCLSTPRNDKRSREPQAGLTTPVPDDAKIVKSKSPFYFEAGYALFAKRPSRPFPPPFLSYPSGSFSDPLSTHNKSRDRRPSVNGDMIRGITNGDDAVLVSDNFIGANDGVGAWAHRERGHAALWSRLILHFWAIEAEKDSYGGSSEPNPVAYLQKAYERTKEATSEPNEWYGTTTACGALLGSDSENPLTQSSTSLSLATRSPDTPDKNAVMDRIVIEEDDVVLAVSDGVVDNLWEHEVLESVVKSLKKWENGEAEIQKEKEPGETGYAESMKFVAQELVKAARVIAEDPFAESPYMEKAIDEGLSIEGGKLDDISVVAAQCKKRNV